MRWFCCGRQLRSKREDQYKVTGKETEDALPTLNEPQFSWQSRRDLDMERFRMHDLDGAIEVRREVGGQPIAVENCKESVLIVLDHTATVTVDDCRDCLIVLGPCAGRREFLFALIITLFNIVFVRDCERCTVLVACQQLRTRDCRSLRLGLHCTTQPIIEGTKEAIFYPLALYYNTIKEDIRAAHLSVFNNNTATVHDFTPDKTVPNFKIINEVLVLAEHHNLALSSQGISTDVASSAIPVRRSGKGERFFVYAGQSEESDEVFLDRCMEFVRLISMNSDFCLISTQDIDLFKQGCSLPISTNSFVRLVVIELCGQPSELPSVLSAGGELSFLCVPQHDTTDFATALSHISQLSLS
uniref:C-CAP/cofactor C-like domain-containing protein n=1 Tax=Heterorhabditis bacteriophora TaxID=37862 RepID=A0A1I7XRS0_HETBA